MGMMVEIESTAPSAQVGEGVERHDGVVSIYSNARSVRWMENEDARRWFSLFDTSIPIPASAKRLTS